MIKKLFNYSLSVAVLATTIQATPTFASPVDSPVTQSQINATKGQIEDFETKIQQLDNRISLAMEKSQQLNDHIKTQHTKINDTKVEIEKAQQDLDAHKKVYSERLKSIQADGKESILTYAEVLLSSDSFSEFLNRFTAISQIMQSDTDLLNGLNEKEQALSDAEKKLHNELDNLTNSQEQLASEQRKIEADKQEIAKELSDAKNKLQDQQGQFAQQEAERRAQIAQQQAQQRAQQQAQQRAQAQQQTHVANQNDNHQSSSNNTSVSESPSNDANLSSSEAVSRVIAFAKKYQGVPYVWGGTTPSGFDCSGFTSYVFRNAVGINLPRVSRDQQNVGTRISPSQVQPGDLVFRGSPAYHVGIYIGGGQYIHAPQTGDVVKIASYNPANFSSAARILH